MVSHRSFWRRSHDRSLHLIVAALVLWTVTFFAYRIVTAVAVSDPVGEMVVRGNALLAVMPTEHPARLDLVDLVQQAQILGAPKMAPPSQASPAASKPTNDQPEPDDQSVAKSVPEKTASTKAATNKAVPEKGASDSLSGKKSPLKPGEKAVTPEVELATRALRIIDQLQDRVDRARDRIIDAKEYEKEKNKPKPISASSKPAGQTPNTPEGAPAGSADAQSTTTDTTIAEESTREPPPTPAEAEKALADAAALLPMARPLRTFALWLADIPKYERERNFWAAFWAITAAAFPASISFWYVVRGRQLPITFPADSHLPAAIVRQRENDRDLRQSTLSAYFLHALMIILPMLGFAHAYNLGPPGGGGGIVGAQAPQEQIKVIKVKQRKLMVNPFSAIRINQPKELEQDLAEETRQMATAKVAGGSGEGEGGGYGQGVKGGSIRFVVLNHGGHGWDEANSIAAPNFLREFGRRVAVPTDRQPIVVRVSDLAAQRDPLQQPPLIYLATDESGFSFSNEDLLFLKKYTLEIGGLILIDDTGGALVHAQTLAARLFPGQPLLPIPNDDIIFRCRQPMADEDRALAKHDGDRILGVRDKGRWVLVFHPGDLVDGWRGAYGVRWQEIAYRFGINCWDYAATQFDHVRTAREKKR